MKYSSSITEHLRCIAKGIWQPKYIVTFTKILLKKLLSTKDEFSNAIKPQPIEKLSDKGFTAWNLHFTLDNDYSLVCTLQSISTQVPPIGKN